MARDSIRCTELTTPGHSLSMMAKAAASDAHEVICDLEDACALSQKVAARDVVAQALRTLPWGERLRAFRVNPVGSPFFEDDLRHVLGAAGDAADVVVVPKVSGADDVRLVCARIGAIERDRGLPEGRIRLEVLVETASALQRIDEVASASPRLDALLFGVADYAADVGAVFDRDAWTDFVYAKQRLVAAARAAGLQAIDGVTFQFRDADLCAEDARRARRAGFDGKWVIHPSQIALVHDAFRPTPEQVARAERVVETHRRADSAEGRGAIVVDDAMVDLASVRVQERVLALARRFAPRRARDGAS